MKKIIVIIMLIAVAFCYATTEVKLDLKPNTTFKQISAQTHIPVNKLSDLLEGKYSKETTLAKSGLEKVDIENAVKKYSETKNRYFGAIVIVGMLIVFMGLVLTGFVISLLKHLNRMDKPKENMTTNGKKPIIKKITPIKGNLSNDSIVAVVTAIYLHELEVDEKNKINLTWKRAPLSMWKSSSVVNLPNRNFFNTRKG